LDGDANSDIEPRPRTQFAIRWGQVAAAGI
jgi:hypothetical protein